MSRWQRILDRAHAWAVAKDAEQVARRAMNAQRCEVREPSGYDGGYHVDGVAPCYRRLAHVEDYECEPCKVREPLYLDMLAKRAEARHCRRLLLAAAQSQLRARRRVEALTSVGLQKHEDSFSRIGKCE